MMGRFSRYRDHLSTLKSMSIQLEKFVGRRLTMRLASALMATRKLHRLLVVDEGKLMGIVTPSDVMKDMLHVVYNLPFRSEAY